MKKRKGFLCRHCKPREDGWLPSIFDFCYDCGQPLFLFRKKSDEPIHTSYGIYKVKKGNGEPFKKPIVEGDSETNAWELFKSLEKYKDDGNNYKCIPIEEDVT